MKGIVFLLCIVCILSIVLIYSIVDYADLAGKYNYAMEMQRICLDNPDNFSAIIKAINSQYLNI